MAKKIRIVEEDLAPGVWGQVISISAEDEELFWRRLSSTSRGGTWLRSMVLRSKRVLLTSWLRRGGW